MVKFKSLYFNNSRILHFYEKYGIIFTLFIVMPILGDSMPIRYVKTKDFYIEKYTLKTPQGDMHYHHAYELYYILKGEREYFVGDSFFHVKEGELMFIPKNMIHRTDSFGATRFLVYFKDEFLEKYFSGQTIQRLVSDQPFVYAPPQKHAAELKELLFATLEEYVRYKIKETGYDEFAVAKLLFDVLYFISTHPNQHTDCAGAQTQRDNRSHEIIKYINDNYSQPLTVATLSEHFGISKDYFSHFFSKNIGITFVTYLNAIRIKKASDMLKQQQNTVSEISELCGFSSSHYFNKVFKQEKGMSPSQYRNQFKVKMPKKR